MASKKLNLWKTFGSKEFAPLVRWWNQMKTELEEEATEHYFKCWRQFINSRMSLPTFYDEVEKILDVDQIEMHNNLYNSIMTIVEDHAASNGNTDDCKHVLPDASVVTAHLILGCLRSGVAYPGEAESAIAITRAMKQLVQEHVELALRVQRRHDVSSHGFLSFEPTRTLSTITAEDCYQSLILTQRPDRLMKRLENSECTTNFYHKMMSVNMDMDISIDDEQEEDEEEQEDNDDDTDDDMDASGEDADQSASNTEADDDDDMTN